MTNDKLSGVETDIAYLKQLAHEGSDAPLLVGPVLVAAATIFGTATAVQWAIAAGVLPLSGWQVLWVWMAAAVIFTAVLVVIIRRMGALPGINTTRNQTIGAAWSACGYGIFATWASFMAYAASTGTWAVMALMPTVVMVAYGSAWMIAGLIAARRWMVLVALVSYVGGVGLAWFSHTELTFALYLVLLGAVALVPGLYLMSQQKGRA